MRPGAAARREEGADRPGPGGASVRRRRPVTVPTLNPACERRLSDPHVAGRRPRPRPGPSTRGRSTARGAGQLDGGLSRRRAQDAAAAAAAAGTGGAAGTRVAASAGTAPAASGSQRSATRKRRTPAAATAIVTPGVVERGDEARVDRPEAGGQDADRPEQSDDPVALDRGVERRARADRVERGEQPADAEHVERRRPRGDAQEQAGVAGGGPQRARANVGACARRPSRRRQRGSEAGCVAANHSRTMWTTRETKNSAAPPTSIAERRPSTPVRTSAMSTRAANATCATSRPST